MSNTESLPDGWTEVDHDPQVVDKYDARQPSLFENVDGTTLQVVPEVGNQAPTGEGDRWRVDSVEGDPAAPEGTTVLGQREGRSDALAFAREAMEHYNEARSLDGVREESAR